MGWLGKWRCRNYGTKKPAGLVAGRARKAVEARGFDPLDDGSVEGLEFCHDSRMV